MSGFDHIVLHAGLSKTGSTSIQNYCHHHRQSLLEQGIVYPQFQFEGQVFDNHSIPLVTSVAPPPNNYALGLMRQFGKRGRLVASECRGQLEAVLSGAGGKTLLLSTERAAGLITEDMHALRELLEPHCRRLRVIAYVRSPESALEAILQERIKAGAMVEPESVVGRIRTRCEALEETFSDLLEIYCYEEQASSAGGVVGHVLQLLEARQATDAKVTRDNPRMSLESFRLADAVNRRYPKRMQGHHGVKREPGDLRRLLELPGQPFHLPGFAGSSLHKAVGEEARWLEQRYGLHFPQLERPDRVPLWQKETTDALPQSIDSVDNPELRACIMEILLAESESIRRRQPEQAAVLAQIARGIVVS